MKILLVKPAPRLKTISTLHNLLLLEPLELAYVAAGIPVNHEIKILDLRLFKSPGKTFIKELRNYSPDVIGISGYTHEASLVKEMSQTAKKILPDAKIVVGGHHATVLPEDYNIETIDVIARGEGCTTFRKIIESFDKGEKIQSSENILLAGKEFNKDFSEKIPKYPEMDSIPEPRRDLYDTSIYKCIWLTLEHPPWKTIFPQVALVRSSFGCSMNCSFCVVPRLSAGRHMKRTPEKVAEEIEKLKADHIYFCDDETFLDEKHAKEVALAIQKRNIKKHYFAWARSTTVNRSPELFKLWKSIGLEGVFLGFEAVSDSELKDLSKHSTVNDNENAHKILVDMGIGVQVGFMVKPAFSKSDFERLVNYVKNMPQTQITFTVYTPSPGSPAWFKEKDTFVCDPYELHDCMHPLSKTSIPLKDFYKYFSMLTNIAGKKNPLRSPKTKLLPKDILKIIYAVSTYARALKKAYKDFPKNLR